MNLVDEGKQALFRTVQCTVVYSTCTTC